MPVPRYLKEAWKAHATPEDIDNLNWEIHLLNHTHETPEQLKAAEKIAEARHKLKGAKRTI